MVAPDLTAFITRSTAIASKSSGTIPSAATQKLKKFGEGIIMDWISASVSDSRRFMQTLWLLTIIGLIIRVAAVFVLNDYHDPLTAEYGIVAKNIVAGKGFVGGGWLGPEMPTALNTPVYPLFLAAWLWVGVPLPFLGVELCQALLSALLIYLTGRIASHWIDTTTGLLSGLMVTFYPPLIYFCKQISPAIFTTFFTIFSLFVLLHFFQRPTWRRAIFLGVVWGISCLVEPILLYGLPGAAFLIGINQGDRIKIIQKLAVTLLIGLLVLLPWTIRNYLVFQQVVLLKTSFDLNFWLGNNPHATGFLYTASGEPMQNTLPASTLEYLSSLNEAERYAVLRYEALQWIAANPLQFLKLTMMRIVYLWVISPTYLITDQNIVEPRYFYMFRSIIQIVLLLLAFLGSVLVYRKYRQFFVLSVWWIVAFTAPYAISVAGNTRYRLPVEPILLVLAGVCVSKLIEVSQQKRASAGI